MKLSGAGWERGESMLFELEETTLQRENFPEIKWDAGQERCKKKN